MLMNSSGIHKVTNHLSRPALSAALTMGALVFAASLFGIYTRPVGFLASVWPANALMLGLLLRLPAAASPAGWLAASVGFVCADLVTGSPLGKTLLLTGANLISVAGAYSILKQYPKDVIRLQTPESIPLLVAAIGFGACLAGGVGALANPMLFNATALRGWTFWFVTEFANYVAILPLLLTAQPLKLPRNVSLRRLVHLALPALGLLVACAAAIWIGGPGAIAFPVPVLLWAAIVYPRFLTVLLTSAVSFWSLVAMSSEHLAAFGELNNENTLISMRLGVSLVALAPMMLASAMARQKELIGQLSHLASRDPLSNLLNRRAFDELAGRRAFECARHSRPVSVLMVDIDHFKSINDRFGHAAGDKVISIAAARLSGLLRLQDVIGRIGGEEFAILLPGCGRRQAIEIAERIRSAFSQTPVSLENGVSIVVTLSVGLAAAADGSVELDALLAEADEALYQAKRLGRNRAETRSEK
ncbi:diguanylate cyclase [Nitratireductor sp. GISD-1A_MAKvit]|uniref:GGDEF domain-containing protein n=1 Tax=Nitratireductor sp. GISD-1A_MAKvit TaxID=3234198 RepID=UPI003465A842